MKIFGNLFGIFGILALILLTLMQVGHHDASAVVGNSRRINHFANSPMRNERGYLYGFDVSASKTKGKDAESNILFDGNVNRLKSSVREDADNSKASTTDLADAFRCPDKLVVLQQTPLYSKFLECLQHHNQQIGELDSALTNDIDFLSSRPLDREDNDASEGSGNYGSADDEGSGSGSGSGSGVVRPESKGQSDIECPDFQRKSIPDSAKKNSKCLKDWDEAQKGASQSSSASPIMQMTLVMALMAVAATFLLQAI